MVASSQQGALQPGKAESCLVLQPPREEGEPLWAPAEPRWLRRAVSSTIAQLLAGTSCHQDIKSQELEYFVEEQRNPLSLS